MIAVAAAGSASSYVSRTDGHSYDHGHGYNHHEVAQPIVHHAVPYYHAVPQDQSWTPAYHAYAPTSYGHGYENSHHEEHNAHPAYKYEYGVKDPKTGDHKSAWEHRDGDKVVGEYTLDEADGTKRVVSYTADDHHGFNAVVKKIGYAHHAPIYGQHYNGNYGNNYGYGHATSYQKLSVPQHHHY